MGCPSWLQIVSKDSLILRVSTSNYDFIIALKMDGMLIYIWDNLLCKLSIIFSLPCITDQTITNSNEHKEQQVKTSSTTDTTTNKITTTTTSTNNKATLQKIKVVKLGMFWISGLPDILWIFIWQYKDNF